MNERACSGCQKLIPALRAPQARYCTDKCGNRARNRRHARRNPEKVLAKRVENNNKVEQRILYRVKSRAKRKGIPFNLTVDDIIVPPICPVLGIPLDSRGGKGSGFHDCSPSLDRIHPDLGYTKGNVRVISGRANLLKSNATVAELAAVLADLRRIHNGSTTDGFGE